MTPTMDMFPYMIDRVLGHEAGYANDPADPGGETKWGISKRSYPKLDIAALTREQAIDIYRRDFWVPLRADKLQGGVAYQLLDSAVNSGIAQSIRFLQRAIGVADDGVFGPASRSALEKTSETDCIMLFIAERLDYMTRLKNWPNHGRGWARRIAGNLRYGAMDS